jgi:hypothetical protein
MLAREAVRELVQRGHREHRDPRQEQVLEAPEPREIAGDLVPMDERGDQGPDDEQRRARDEERREAELEPGFEAVEQAVGVERLKRTQSGSPWTRAAACAGAVRRGSRAGHSEELFHERRERLGRDLGLLLGRHLLGHRLERRLAVQPPRDRVLHLAQPEEAARPWDP